MAFGDQKSQTATGKAPKFKASDQQAAVVDRVVHDGKNVSVSAFAGAGKTSTFELVGYAYHQKHPSDRITSIQYNKTMADEAKKRFPAEYTEVSTAHSLAARSKIHGKPVRDLFMGRLVRGAGLKTLRERISEDLPNDVNRVRHWFQGEYTAVTSMLTTLQNFMQSGDTSVSENHASREHAIYIKDMVSLSEALEFRKVVGKCAQNLWDKMQHDKTFPITDDVYLKAWEMHGYHGGRPLVLFDEAQDGNPVMLSVLRKMQKEGSQVVLVGDRHQSLYQWRGATDAMKAFPEFDQLYLTESYRFGQIIANHAQLFLSVEGERNKLIGLNREPGRFEDLPHAIYGAPFDPDAILCRTNAGVILESIEAIQRGGRPYIVGNAGSSDGAADAARLLEAIGGLYDNNPRRPRHAEVSLFETWQDIKDFSENDDGKQLRTFVRMTEEHKQHGSFDNIVRTLKEDTAKTRESADVVVSTIHKSKGLEFDKVAFGQDIQDVNLVNAHKYIDDNGQESMAYSLNNPNRMLLYVAGTRAKNAFDAKGFYHMYEQQVEALHENPLTKEIKEKILAQRQSGQTGDDVAVRQSFSKAIKNEFKQEDY